MRLTTSGSIRRFDYSLLVAALAPLRQEWTDLRFDADGLVVNPITGEPTGGLRLVEGRHRQPGARYEAIAQTGEDDASTIHLTLRRDDARTLALTAVDPRDLWSVDIDLHHGRIPRVDLAARADATELIADGGAPRWLARRIGGAAAGTMTVDLATIEQRSGGTVAQGSGHLRLLRGSGSATVAPTTHGWDVAVSVKARGRGLGRIAMRLLGGQVRSSFETSAAATWSSMPTTIDRLETYLRESQRVVDGEGGIEPVIHRMLWDATFDEHVTTTYDLE